MMYYWSDVTSLCGLFGGSKPGRGGAHTIAGFLPPQAFERCLEIERARADRAGSKFCVIAFSIETVRSADAQAPFEALAAILRERTRISDIRGWLDGRLAVLLPDTDADGAATLSHVIRSASDGQDGARSAAIVRSEILYYPDAEPAPAHPKPHVFHAVDSPGGSDHG